METTLEGALTYLHKGLAPIVLTSPLDESEPDHNKRGKKPLHAEGWTKKPIPTEHELRADYAINSLYNIGLRTGIIQGCELPIVGFDVDGNCVATWDNVVNQMSDELRNLITNTWTIKTGQGKRPIFSINVAEYPEGTVPSVKLVTGSSNHDEIALLGNGRHSVAPPSIHPLRRTPYSDNGKEILTIRRAQLEEIVRIVKAANPNSEDSATTKDRIPIEDIFKPGIKFHDGEKRHVQLRRAIIELVRNNAKILPMDKIKELAWDYNNTQFDPPLPRDDFEKRWSYAMIWLESHPELIKGNGIKDRPKTKYQTIAEKYRIGDEMLNNIGAVTSDYPHEFVISHSSDKRVKMGYLKKREDLDGNGNVIRTTYYLSYGDTILDAIPERITIIKDPLEDVTKYEIELLSANGDSHTFGPLPFAEIIAEIEKTPLCFKPRSLHSYLAPLLRAYIESDRVEQRTEIDREGFFWVDGKIHGSKVEIRPVDKAQANAAVGFIQMLRDKFYDKPRDTQRLAHCLRLACVAPFDFARRQMGVAGDNNFIPRLDLYGWANTGKTYGYPRIILRVWRREVDGDYIKGNGSVGSAPRFIHNTGKSTFPLIMDEVDSFAKWESDPKVADYISMLKNQCSVPNPRDTLTKDSANVSRPSLAFPIITHNSDRITEDGFVKRYIGFGFSPDDEITKERGAAFTQFLDENKDVHGTIGDFVSGYIVANQSLLKENWETIATKALTALYELAGVEVPSWLWSRVEHGSTNDTREARQAQIKAAITKMIIDAWAQNRSELGDKNSNTILSFEEKIKRLATNSMLPHIRLHDSEGVCILSTFADELRDKHKLTRITLNQLAPLCGWNYKPVRLGDEGSTKLYKVVCAPLDKFVSFLNMGSVQEELTNEN